MGKKIIQPRSVPRTDPPGPDGQRAGVGSGGSVGMGGKAEVLTGVLVPNIQTAWTHHPERSQTQGQGVHGSRNMAVVHGLTGLVY